MKSDTFDISNLEYSIKNNFIEKMLFLWIIMGILLYIITEIRALMIGWVIRDLIYTILMALIIIVFLFRKKIKPAHKAFFLISINLIIAVSGTVTLGMFAGGIFFFQLTAFIAALFYSKKTVWTLIFIMILYLTVLSYCFTTGIISIKQSAESLIRNPMIWVTFISTLTGYFIFASQILITYLHEIRQLLNEISRQRDKLSKAMDEINQLNKLLPICASCKKIKDDSGYWNKVEKYIEDHSGATFTHGLCPDCAKKLYPDEYDDNEQKKQI